MTKLSKTLLVASVLGIVTGLIVDLNESIFNPVWTVLLPLGAISFQLFIITLLLAKETAKYDAEEARKMQLIQPPAGNTTPVNHDHPDALPAHS
jgi:hypothetical protein